ncbi:site-2 protease family protein [Ereboglobus luteus]|nr:site-2 protease family protein [Ereboglobus luteus]
MQTITWLIVAIIGLWLGFQIVRLLSVVRFLGKTKFTGNRITPVAENDTPVWLRELAITQESVLLGEGFVRRHEHTIQLAIHADIPIPCIEYILPGQGVSALLRPNEPTVRPGECHVTLVSKLSNGQVLVTRSIEQHEIIPPPARLQDVALPDADLKDLIARHLARVEDAAKQGVLTVELAAAGDFAQLLNDLTGEHEAMLRASPVAFTRPDGTLQLRFFARLKIARRLIRESLAIDKREAARMRTLQSPPPLMSVENQAEMDWFQHHAMMESQRRGQSSAWLPKLLIMLGSLALFIIALRWIMSWETVVVIAIALTIHECGHLLGMKLFGYKDTQLLFLPFFGGAAVARDPLVLAPWKHLVILFLGPLPGIFAGIAMLLFAPDDPASMPWLSQAGIMFIVFNAFNLLPILPLDGGQIADVALVSRAPRLRAVFTAVSALALIALGLGAAALI